jgi:hypothetical protein
MARIARSSLLLASLVFCSGCLARQVAKDGKDFRQSLLDLYTDQLMDNLIRARSGQPFVQLAYSSLIVQDFNSAAATVMDTPSRQSVRGFDLTKGMATSLARTFGNMFNFTGGDRLEKTLSFHADPVTDKNDIYEYYLAFALDPSLFVVTDKAPPCPVHIMRKCKGKYYWVPKEAGGVFLELALKTTFMRGPETAPPPLAWEVKIAKVERLRDKQGNDQKPTDGTVTFYVIFDKEVPNDDATMVATLPGGRRVRLTLNKVDLFNFEGGKQAAAPDEGKLINQLIGRWDPEKLQLDGLNLQGAFAQIFSYRYPPAPPPTPPDLKRLQDNVDQIRLNLQNLRLEGTP